MALQTLSSPQLTAPAAAAGVSVTPSGTAFANSSWVELITSTASAIVLTGLTLPTVGAAADFEVDIGTGGSGSESVVTTFRGKVQDASAHGLTYMPLVIPLDNIATTTRVAVRMRKSGTSTTAWKFAITYVAKPFTGTMLTTAKPQLCLPSAAAGATVTLSATPWANSSYVQLSASMANASVLTGVVVSAFASTVQWELDIATGGSGSETVITTIRGSATTAIADGPAYIPIRVPLDNIAASARLSCRMRASTTGSPTVAVTYIEKPL